MNLTKILAELRRERKLIDEAILALERLLAGSGPRRGRPPGWLREPRLRGRPRKKPPGTAGPALRQDGASHVIAG
jgi:hypothetical protein